MRKLWKSVSKIMLAVLLTTQLAGSTGSLLVQAEEEPIETVEESEQVDETEAEEEQEEDVDNSDESDEQEFEIEESTEDVYEEDDEADTEEQVATEDTEEALTVEPVAISLLSEVIDEEIQSEEAVETTTAAFYVLVRGGDRKNLNASNYIPLGNGKITDAQKIYDDYDEIKEHLYEIPSISKLELTEHEEVRWYSIKKESDGWHVDGEIINNTATDEEPQEVELPYENLDDCDMMDFSNWRSGCYDWENGKYFTCDSRICLRDYKKVKPGSCYYAATNDIDYQILVREMNQDGKMLVSHNLKDGDKLEIGDDTAYVGVGIYNAKGTAVKIKQYTQMFACGFAAVLSLESKIELPQVKEPELPYENLVNCDMTNFSNWRSGCYDWKSGEYISYDFRICLTDYKKVEPGSSYYAMMTDTDYHILVREMSKDGRMLVSHNLEDGDKLEIGDDTRYVGVGIYNAKGTTVTMKQYSQMFADGFVAVLSSTPQIGLPKPELQYEELDECNMASFSNWKSGTYDSAFDSFKEDAAYLSVKEYKKVTPGTVYKAYLSAKTYQFVVNSYNKKSEFLKTYTLSDGETFIPTEEEVFVAVSVHRTDAAMTYSDYESYFNTGYSAILSSKDGIDILHQPTSVYEELELMLATGDMTEHDISAYKCTYIEYFNVICPKFKKDHKIEFASIHNMYPDGTISGAYMKTCMFTNMDADYLGRFQRTKKSVEEYLSMLDSKMTDLDKVVLAHEFITKKTQYASVSTVSHSAGGALGDGKAVCQGYTEAMTLLMEYAGVEVDEAISKSMNHSWSYVKIDGNWYHLDATWDDTQRGTDEVYAHRFLIRNAEEFRTIKGNSRAHSDWYFYYNTKEESTSTAFTNWFVHDVAGFMYYHDGLWYYRDKNMNSIKCSDIYGNHMQIVIDGTNQTDKIQITGMQGNVMYYKIGSAQYTKEI